MFKLYIIYYPLYSNYFFINKKLKKLVGKKNNYRICSECARFFVFS